MATTIYNLGLGSNSYELGVKDSSHVGGLDSTLTELRDEAESAFNEARDAFDYASQADDKATDAYNQANEAYITANGADQRAWNAYDRANAAYAKADGGGSSSAEAYNRANAAYSQANTATTAAGTAFDRGNEANVLAGRAYDRANAAYAKADGGGGGGGGSASEAYDRANNAYARANYVYTNPQMAWLGDEELEQPGAVHVMPFKLEFNNNIGEDTVYDAESLYYGIFNDSSRKLEGFCDLSSSPWKANIVHNLARPVTYSAGMCFVPFIKCWMDSTYEFTAATQDYNITYFGNRVTLPAVTKASIMGGVIFRTVITASDFNFGQTPTSGAYDFAITYHLYQYSNYIPASVIIYLGSQIIQPRDIGINNLYIGMYF